MTLPIFRFQMPILESRSAKGKKYVFVLRAQAGTLTSVLVQHI